MLVGATIGRPRAVNNRPNILLITADKTFPGVKTYQSDGTVSGCGLILAQGKCLVNEGKTAKQPDGWGFCSTQRN